MNASDELNRPDYAVSARTHYATEVEIAQALISALISAHAPDTRREGKKEQFNRERQSMLSRL
jgi:hypothetical protein